MATCNLVATRLTDSGGAKEWQISLGEFVPKSNLKANSRLAVCGMIEGKSVVEYRTVESGERISAFELGSPVVWDGMALANGRLYFSLTSGRLACYQ